MTATTPIQDMDLEFDNGSFDSASFAAATLANWQALAAVIDHTLLKPDATRDQVESLCDEAIRYRFACITGFGKRNQQALRQPLRTAAEV